MKKLHAEERILGIPREAGQGSPLPDLLRRRGIAQNTYHRWKSKFSGLEPSHLRRLREPERENGQLKKIVAGQAMGLPWGPLDPTNPPPAVRNLNLQPNQDRPGLPF